MSGSAYAMTLDTVSFAQAEIPERMEWADVLSIAEHDFPGGTRTQKTFGTFAQPIQFSGLLLGSHALSRSDELQQMANTPVLRTLTYGPEAWRGRVSSYKASVRHQWMVGFTIDFKPITRLLSGPQPLDALSAIGGLDSVLDLHLLCLQGLLAGNVPGTGLLLGLYAPSIAGPVNALVSSVNVARLGVPGGSAANFTQPTITALQGNCAAVQTAAAPLIAPASAYPLASAPAAEASARASAISTAINQNPSAQTYVQCINPSLPHLAAQYFGDPTLWTVIAARNNLPPDPMPIGQFRLFIPAKSGGNAPS